VSKPERSNAVIWDAVKRVAKRAGVSAHVHSLRAAFAVLFDEAFPNQPFALKDLLGHERIETTMIYLRRKNRDKAMEVVRDLSWRALNEAEVPQAADNGVISHAASASLSALSEGGVEQGQSDVLDTSPVGIDPLDGLPHSLSESASRQDILPDPPEYPKPLPPEPEEAHTGFEPVFLLSLVAMLLQQEDDALDDTNSHAIVEYDIVTDTQGQTPTGAKGEV
jgi:hypothetical protein